MSPRNCAPGAVVGEGRALLYVPDVEKARSDHGIEPAWLEVFYNPRMTYNRDLSVAVLSAYAKRLAPVPDFHVVEPLTATGVRAVRYALESEVQGRILAGDVEECAVAYARLNASLNNVDDRIIARRADARELLYSAPQILGKAPLYVDIDPFGSPAPFTSPALSVLGVGGLLGVTATDLAVLEGSKWRAAYRKYWAVNRRVPESKEVGLRILLGHIARTAASMDKWVRPLLAYYADHYYRVYVQVGRGARKADKMLEDHVGHAYYCPGENRTYLTRDPPACASMTRPRQIGPLWIGPLNSEEFVRLVYAEVEARDYLETRRRALSLLETLECESKLEDNLHLLVEQVARYARRSMPKVSRLVELLHGEGYRACRSHYAPTAIRTDAPYMEVVRLISLS
ncbi:MAG: tRNA (guanine(26)-N(2))-dimethyltransferase [Desulfurococcales archaeon]|nr:tRNA (guanine(26)-N(2))-dimethyltransferase [Desulfurococcales archaeon]